MKMEERMYFSIGTKIDLQKEKELTESLLNTILGFTSDVIPDTELMICYDDDKGHKKPKITKKSLDTFFEKFRNGKVFLSFTLSDYMPWRVYNGFYSEVGDEIKDTFSCNIYLDLVGRYKYRNTVSIYISERLLDSDEKTARFISLFTELQKLLHGDGAFISIGVPFGTNLGLFDDHYFSSSWEFSGYFDKYVSGYFWGNCLTKAQAEKLGGIDKIKQAGFAVVSDLGDSVYIQSTQDPRDYDIDKALEMKRFLEPLFPPRKYKRHGSYMPASVFDSGNNESMLKYFEKCDLCDTRRSKEYRLDGHDIKNRYSTIVCESAVSNGFSKCGNVFYRSQNGVFTAFYPSLVSPESLGFDVEFCIFPMCANITVYAKDETYDICNSWYMSEVVPARKSGCLCVFAAEYIDAPDSVKDKIWESREERINEILTGLASETEKYLLPYLVSADSPQKGYLAVCDRYPKLKKDNSVKWYSAATPFTWAMQMKDAELTKVSLEAYIREMIAYNVHEDAVTPCKKLLAELDSGNMSYVDACLRIMVDNSEKRISSGEFIEA